MICPNCKTELSKVWKPQRSTDAMARALVQWSCSTCGGTFNREQLRSRPARPAKAAPLQPGIV